MIATDALGQPVAHSSMSWKRDLRESVEALRPRIDFEHEKRVAQAMADEMIADYDARRARYARLEREAHRREPDEDCREARRELAEIRRDERGFKRHGLSW